jgi:hypothetical protein
MQWLLRRRKSCKNVRLAVTDNTEELVYNAVDNVLKQTEFKSGKFQVQVQ